MSRFVGSARLKLAQLGWLSQFEPSCGNTTPPLTDAFLITRKDSEILSEFLDEFQDGDGEIRNKIITNVMAAVFLARPDGDPFNKSEASMKIRKWFYNRYDRPERQYVKFIRRWSARNAYYHLCWDEVMTKAEEMSGDLPGSCAFMGSLQDATTKLWKNISDEERLNGQFCQRKNYKQVMATLFEADKPNDTQQSFLSFCPDWKNAPLFKEWQELCEKVL
ncbi:hypothetical protein V8E53_004016 [Lactarius tabidus]